MFGGLFRSFSAGVTAAKTTNVLLRTYGVSISHPDHLAMIDRIAKNFSESLNEHEMAVQFLAEFSRTIQADHPKARAEVEKYIRMSKGAYARGLARAAAPQDALFRVARERFGIDHAAIAGA